MRPHLLLLPLLPLALAADSLNNFDFYPQAAQQCLYDAAASANCTGTTVAELNTCQCGNEGDFIISAAKCVGEKDEGDVQSVYDTMSKACRDSGTPMGVSEKGFKDAAAGKTATGTGSVTGTAGTTAKSTATAAATTTKGGQTITVTPTPTGDSDNDGLSTGAMIGIGVGAAVLASLAILGVVVFFIRRRRRRTGEEAHPMLPPQNSNPYGPTAFATSSETKPAWTDVQKPWSAEAYGQAPPYSAGGYTGGGFAAAGGLPVQQQSFQQQQHQPAVFEMQGTEVTEAVEMPGTIPGQHPQHHGGWPR